MVWQEQRDITKTKKVMYSPSILSYKITRILCCITRAKKLSIEFGWSPSHNFLWPPTTLIAI